MRKFVGLLLFSFILVACGENEKENINTRKVNITANAEIVVEKDLIVKTRYVLDHRKPIGSESSRNGDVTVKIRLYNGHNAIDTALNSKYPNAIVIRNYRISLNAVLPYPEINIPRKQADYDIQMTLEKIN